VSAIINIISASWMV